MTNQESMAHRAASVGLGILLAMSLATSQPALGQTTTPGAGSSDAVADIAAARPSAGRRPASTVELSAGSAVFADDNGPAHRIVGGTYRAYISPRVALGPELVYFDGSGDHSDLAATVNLTFDLRRPDGRRPRRVVPYLLAGGGWFQYRDAFQGIRFTSSEGALTGGGGVRVWPSHSMYLGAEYRLGWELHARLSGHVGWSLGR
jgi:hypothetical protein